MFTKLHFSKFAKLYFITKRTTITLHKILQKAHKIYNYLSPGSRKDPSSVSQSPSS